MRSSTTPVTVPTARSRTFRRPKPVGSSTSTFPAGSSTSTFSATSGTTAYAAQARMVGNLLGAADNNPCLVSPPEVIANAVGKAVTARRPRTRHVVVGGGAKPIIVARRILSDRAFDRLIVAMFKAVGGRSARRNEVLESI